MLTVKKGALALAAAIIAFSGTVGILCGGISSAQARNTPVIVIDAGHGGIDAGVRGKKSGVKESDINLSISRELAGFFCKAGFNTVLTRKSQAGLYGLPTKGFKLRDMQKRRQIIQECGADMVISVHQNFYSDTSRRGAQVFFNKESQSGKQLAVCIQQSLNSMEGAAEKNSPLIGDYYMLECTDSPSVIVECGFLSNESDEALLSDEEYRTQIAYAIFSGAITYFT